MSAARTHLRIDPRFSGRALHLAEGRAEVELETLPEMAADEHDLVHGGFVFSLADYAAMLAINHPRVVLGQAEARFLRPVQVGERLVASATAGPVEGKKHPLEVVVRRGSDEVLQAHLTCFIPERHVLAPKEPR